MEEPFFNLPEIGLDRSIDNFVLDTEFYEKEITKRNGGLDLTSLRPNCLSPQDYDRYEKLIPHHYDNRYKGRLSGIVKKAKKLPLPIAKLVKDIKELEKDIVMVYQVAYAHYVIAKHNDLTKGDNSFPKNCCGICGGNMTASLMLHGLLHASYSSLGEQDSNHGYVILPFVMLDPPMEGVILVDPTSDQLGKCEGKVRRNFVAIKQGTKWDYKTEYANGMNLFPVCVLYLGSLSKMEGIRSSGALTDNHKLYFQGGKQFLESAFSNPVDLETPLNKAYSMLKKFFYRL